MQTSRDADSARGRLSLARAGSNQVWWIDSVVDIKLTASQTDGHVGLWYWIGRRGAASPLHVHHREDEQFLVVDGRIRFFMEDERIDAGPGDLVFLPREIPHAYLVTSDAAKAVGMVPPEDSRPSSRTSERPSGPASPRARPRRSPRLPAQLCASASRSSAPLRRSTERRPNRRPYERTSGTAASLSLAAPLVPPSHNPISAAKLAQDYPSLGRCRGGSPVYGVGRTDGWGSPE